MLWKLFYGKSKEEYFQEVMDRLTGMDSHYSDLSSGMEDVRGLLEDSRMNGGLQEEKIDRLLTIMEDWMNTYEEKVNQLGVADEQELKRELERERERSAQAEQKEKEYEKRITSLQVQAEKKEKEHGQRIASLQDQAEEYKRKQEESEQSVWAMQKEVQSLKKQLNNMQTKQLNSISKKRNAQAGRKVSGGGTPGLSKEEQSMIQDHYDFVPVSKNSKTTIFNPMRYSK